MPRLSLSILIIVLGGLFGWVLGKLPERWVYVIVAVSLIAAVVALKS